MHLLTIGIPTYERTTELCKICDQLRQILSDIPEVRVVICDNSQDESIVRLNREAAQPFEYYRNSSNVGFAGNLLNILSKCNSEYLWFLSDDDQLYQESVERLLLRLASRSLRDFDCLVLPFSCSTESSPINTAADFQFPENLNEIFLNTDRLPFVLFSSFIIRPSQLSCSASSQSAELINSLEPYRNNDLIQIIIVLMCLSTNARLRFYPDPIIKYIPGDIGRFLPSSLLASELEVLSVINERFNMPRKRLMSRRVTFTNNQLKHTLRIKAGVQQNKYLQAYSDYLTLPNGKVFLEYADAHTYVLWFMTLIPCSLLKPLYKIKDRIKALFS